MNNSQESNQIYICPICGNTDIHSTGYLNGKPYCRRCISFKGEEVEHKTSYPKKAPIHLSYELSSEQKELSDKLVENYKKGIDSLVFAVCGSGKTEITMKVISKAISEGKKVGFTIPRRDVVIELQQRLKEVFYHNSVVPVYGGMNERLYGDIVCLTTHQLYRYEDYFDLLIMDEVDAFPYKGNETLESFFKRAIKDNGCYIMLSATPSASFISKLKNQNVSILELNSRFHNHLLPVPKIIIKSKPTIFLALVSKIEHYMKLNKQVFVFTPTIEICEKTYSFLKLLISKGACLHSKIMERGRVIEDFKSGLIRYLITTSVLERGVTVKDVQVIVFKADHSIFDRYTLIQISGRVGRKPDAPDGDVLFIGLRKTKEMTKAIERINEVNEKAKNEIVRN